MQPEKSQVTQNQVLLTPKDVATRLGVTINTLAVWRCHGTSDLPFVKIGRCVRYRQQDVEQFINGHVFLHCDKPLADEQGGRNA